MELTCSWLHTAKCEIVWLQSFQRYLQLRKMLESFHKHVGLVCAARHHMGDWSKWKCSGCSLLVVADPPSIWQTLAPAAVVPGTPKHTVTLINNGCFGFMVRSYIGAYLYLIIGTSGCCIDLFYKCIKGNCLYMKLSSEKWKALQRVSVYFWLHCVSA